MSLACKIDLYVSGDENQLAAFHAAFVRPETEPPFTHQLMTDFGAFVPEPDTAASDGDRSRWMQDNWGPRWEGFDVKVEKLPNGGYGYSFWVKNGEPTQVVEAASRKFPGLDFEYWYAYEDGSDQDNRVYRAGEEE